MLRTNSHYSWNSVHLPSSNIFMLLFVSPLAFLFSGRWLVRLSALEKQVSKKTYSLTSYYFAFSLFLLSWWSTTHTSLLILLLLVMIIMIMWSYSLWMGKAFHFLLLPLLHTHCFPCGLNVHNIQILELPYFRNDFPGSATSLLVCSCYFEEIFTYLVD